MQTNHLIVEFICDSTNINFALSRCDNCECINFLCLPFPALPGSTIHAFSVSFFWELSVSPGADKQLWLELHCRSASAQPCALLPWFFWKDPHICLLYDDSGLAWAPGWTISKTISHLRILIPQKCCFPWKQAGFSAPFTETRQMGRLPFHLLQASWHSAGSGAACLSHWTSWLSWLSSCPASHLAACSNCLPSWLAFHLGSQIPVQKFLKHVPCGFKTIKFSEIKLGNKAKFS